MGSGSPIVSQARAGAPPDAACLVVGTMASGYDKEGNVDGDYLYSTAASGSLGHQGFEGVSITPMPLCNQDE